MLAFVFNSRQNAVVRCRFDRTGTACSAALRSTERLLSASISSLALAGGVYSTSMLMHWRVMVVRGQALPVVILGILARASIGAGQSHRSIASGALSRPRQRTKR
ncbi:hypothetical protein [Methylobacterium crusticola]|uniref:hypothetical protein n=1 Tax=Methylobacterium crusticola TaxID=1697972 RepID=UPI000FFB485F|nr:hypothetical protein [Methylobacterium crusticola]